MEQKIIKMPFDIELAKKITEKSVKGRIVTRDGRNARIACWNYKSLSGEYPLLVLIENGIFEAQELYTLNGKEKSFIEEACDSDLMLEIPEYLTFKDGDIIYAEVDNGGGDHWKWLSIVKDIDYILGPYVKSYVDFNLESPINCGSLEYNQISDNISIIRRATEEEKTMLKERLKKSNSPDAKEYLKRFFGEETSPKVSNSPKIGKEEFKPFDRVLVRQSKSDKWEAMLFSNYTSEIHRYRCGGMNYMFCIPYEGNEHLLDTTNDYKKNKLKQ